MRARCTWVFASARSFNRTGSVRRALRSLRSELHPLQAHAFPLRRVSKVGFPLSHPACWPTEQDHHADSFLAHSLRGQAPSSSRGKIGASRLTANLSGGAESIGRATNTLLRNFVSNFPAPAPCLPPQTCGLAALVFTPIHPSLAQCCACSFLAAQTAPAP